MYGDFFRLALICALGTLLIVAAITDLRSRIISNRLNLIVAALAPLWWIACGLPLWPDVVAQLGAGIVVFAIFAGLFALGLMGGGDVKLLGALALWFPWQILHAQVEEFDGPHLHPLLSMDRRAIKPT